MTTYTLVHPYIIGKFNSVVTAQNENDAAQQIWNNLSGYITGNVPEFVFTLGDANNQYYTFRVEENPNDSGKYANYTITPLEFVMTPGQKESFTKQLKRLERGFAPSGSLYGGKKHKKRYEDVNNDDSSSSSSSSDSVYEKFGLFSSINHQKPIVYLWYAPLIYDLPRFYMPTFSAPLTPYVEINLSSAF